MFRPKSCQATPIVIEVRPTIAPAWISIPPVIMTKVTNRLIKQIAIKSFTLESNSGIRRNLAFAVPKITNSRIRKSSRNAFQLCIADLMLFGNPFFI